jgi:hypothetical protein
LLELSDLDHDARAGIQQLDQLLIDLIDFQTERIEGIGVGHDVVLAARRLSVKNARPILLIGPCPRSFLRASRI